MGKKTVLITGCSRGIGLGLVKEFISREYNVIATCRHPEKSDELSAVLASKGQNGPIACDISSDDSIEHCKEIVYKLTDQIDILVNNAGISNKEHPIEPPSKTKREEFLHIMNTNVAGPLMMTQAFLPLLQRSKAPKVINISSGLGSVDMASNITCTSYRCSKSALNMLSKVFSVEYPEVVFLSVCPGWVQTDLGRVKNAIPTFTVEESARGIVTLTEKVEIVESGQFLNLTGKTIPY